MKYYSQVECEEIGSEKTGVKFSELTIGTFFSDTPGDGSLYVKISNAKSQNSVSPYTGDEADTYSFYPGDIVYICDVKIEWRVR